MKCRSCGGPTTPLLSLGYQPLANHLLASPDTPYQSYPLDVLLCHGCHLGQLSAIVSPELLFTDYVYHSSVCAPLVAAADQLVDNVYHPGIEFVVEIGSNDGYLLQFYRDYRVRVLGIDPARGPANAAAIRGIPTIQSYFTLALARTLPKADIIHANNVLAHVPDLDDFVAGIAVLLAPHGTCFIEVPYLGSLLERCEFDTVYHEHVYYFSFRSLETLFHRHGLFIRDIERRDSQSGTGSFRVCLDKNPASQFKLTEDIPTAAAGMQTRIETVRSGLTETITALRHDGHRVWGFGAAAKATVMMNACGITSDLIDAVADEAPAKNAKYIPGTGVQILSTGDWLVAAPEYTCIFAWTYAEAIQSRYAKRYRGQFFTPMSPLVAQ